MDAAAGPSARLSPGPGPRAWRDHPRSFAVLVAFVAATLPLGVAHLLPLTAEACILVVLVAATALSRRGALCWAWATWLAAIVALDDLRSLQHLVGPPHASDVAAAEARVFGGAQPVVALQAHLAGAGLRWEDVLLAAVYLLHTPAPLLCGAALWAWRRGCFRPFVASILVAAVVGLVVYLVFPESPPWLAADEHLIAPVRRITSEVVAHAGPLAGVYGGADPLPNAAMPSLHVAYPVIVAYWLVRAFGWRALPALGYPLVLCLGVVYLGEHWVVDVVAGVLLAGLACAAATALEPWLARPRPQRAPAAPVEAMRRS